MARRRNLFRGWPRRMIWAVSDPRYAGLLNSWIATDGRVAYRAILEFRRRAASVQPQRVRTSRLHRAYGRKTRSGR